jgi:hypothetical protein
MHDLEITRMTEFKIEVLNGEIFVIQYQPAPTTYQDVKHGPYKNEKSAKQRIRDLKRKEVNEWLVREAEKLEAATHCEPIELPPELVRQVGCYPAIPKSAYQR